MDLDGPRKGVLVGRGSPYPEEFRNDAVALYRAADGRRTYAAVAADVGVTGEMKFPHDLGHSFVMPRGRVDAAAWSRPV